MCACDCVHRDYIGTLPRCRALRLRPLHAISASLRRRTPPSAAADVRNRTRQVTDTVSPEYALAMRALAAEEMRGGALDPVAAGDQALRRLREQLLLWFGPDGVHALFARAINRAAVVHPMLVDVRSVSHDGRHLDRLPRPVPAERAEYVREALVMLLATLFALLGRLVGHDLVVLVTNQIWPADGGKDDRQTEPRSRIRE
jgi:hypothetical protein